MTGTMTAALWGLVGAFPYAATRLATAYFGTEETLLRVRRLASAQFAIALFTGPAIAAASAPWLLGYARGANLASVALAIGLFSNAIWPMLTDKRAVRFLTSQILGRLGGWLSGIGKQIGEPNDD